MKDRGRPARRRILLACLALTALSLLAPGPGRQARPERPASPRRTVAAAGGSSLLARFAQLPLSFEANEGQVDGSVKFLSRGSGYSLFLTATEAVLSLAVERRSAVLGMQLVGANPEPRMEGLEELPGKVNYLIGNDPEKWRTNVPTYGKVRSCDVYPGVDLVYYGNRGELEYDLVVSAGVDPGVITLGFEGAESLVIDGGGDLVLQAGGREIRQHRPVIYQEADGARRRVPGGYVVRGERQVGFRVGAYDADRPLVIDPVLSYATYLGNSEWDDSTDIAVDAGGNAYVTGDTHSIDFPGTSESPLQPDHGGGGGDAYVTKVNASGTELVYSTYLGGSGHDRGIRIAVDAGGNAYVTGDTQSDDFPGTAESSIQSDFGGELDAFVTKVNASGTELVYSTYLGGSGTEEGLGIAVDAGGNACVTGDTRSDDFPGTATSSIQSDFGGELDAFVTKVNAGGTELVYSTYLGGSGYDRGIRIAVDAGGNAYVTGGTESDDFPTESPIQDALVGGEDAFVTKVNASGTALVYSTYLGGSGRDAGAGIAVDAGGNAYVTGGTYSDDFPGTAGSPIQSDYGGAGYMGGDAFVTKVNASGTALSYSTYLGGSGSDSGYAIAVDWRGNAYLTGRTDSDDLPGTNESLIQADYGGGMTDGFVARIGMVDTDGDGLPDLWETEGYTAPNGEEVPLHTMGAQVNHKDVFVDVDYMVGDAPNIDGNVMTFDHRPDCAALDEIKAAFAAAPVDNPDGTTGITLHVRVAQLPCDDAAVTPRLPFEPDLGSLNDQQEYLWVAPMGDDTPHFMDLKSLPGVFPEELGYAIHYCIFAHRIATGQTGISRGNGAGDFIVSLGWVVDFESAFAGTPEGSTVKASPEAQAGTFMHELGHNLGLDHGGGDGMRQKPNYLSIMNKDYFQMTGLIIDGEFGSIGGDHGAGDLRHYHFDYSREALPGWAGNVLDEADLDESVGLEGSAEMARYGTTYYSSAIEQRVDNVNDPIEWDVSDADTEPPIEMDVTNLDGIKELKGHDDWANLVYDGGILGGGIALLPPVATPADELTTEEAIAQIHAPALVGKLKGHVAKKMLHLTWKPVGPGYSYKVYRTQDDQVGAVQVWTTTTTEFKDKTVVPGVVYTYAVAAVDPVFGAESAVAEAVSMQLRK